MRKYGILFHFMKRLTNYSLTTTKSQLCLDGETLNLCIGDTPDSYLRIWRSMICARGLQRIKSECESQLRSTFCQSSSIQPMDGNVSLTDYVNCMQLLLQK